MTPKLSNTILIDNNTLTDHYLSGEPGLSFLLETGGKKILFDTGYSGLFLQNAQNLGMNLLDLDVVVLSHGHLDHTGGLFPLIRHITRAAIEGFPVKRPMLVAHPLCFSPRPKFPVHDVGTVLSEQELERFFELSTTTIPQWLTDRLVFLGEIERTFTFEQVEAGTRKIVMPDGRTVADLIPDDSALAFRTDNGLVIFTGCSHAGICNIAEKARTVCKDDRIIDITGGLHLLQPERCRLQKTAEYLRNLDLESLHACHCTSLSSKLFLADYCPVREVGVGMHLVW